MSVASSPSPGRRRRTGLRLWADITWYAFLALICLALIFVAMVSVASTRPAFCGLCHVGAFTSAHSTGHTDQSCDSCHTGVGGFELASSRLAVVQMIPQQLLPGSKPTSTYVSNDVCTKCHGSELLETRESNGLRMNHRALIEAKWSCIRCHATVGHGNRSLRKVGYSMDMCLPCHSTNPANTATCQTCHPDKTPKAVSRDFPTPYSVTHGDQTLRTHGMGDLASCKACHAPQQCQACHDVEMPHPSTFIGGHGQLLLAGSLTSKTCATCHQSSTCDSCHGVPMPHPEGFTRGHSKDLQGKSEKVCLRCHTEKSCTTCHIAHTHPGLPADLREKLRANPVS